MKTFLLLTPRPKEGRLLEILHFQEREQGKNKRFKKQSWTDIGDANVCFNLLDEDTEDDDFVDVV